MHDSRRATPEGRNDYRYRRWWPEEAGDLLEATVDCKLPDLQACDTGTPYGFSNTQVEWMIIPW